MPTSFKYLIYIKLSQGRKFNARKEDVDDMDYLGLRVYRWQCLAKDVLSLKDLPEKKTSTGSTSSAQPACLRSALELTLKVATMCLKQGQPGPDQVNFVFGSGLIRGGFQEF